MDNNMNYKPSLVKYAGEYWVTLSDMTQTRSTEGYSGEASVKSAVRTFVLRQDTNKYVAFRGENQIENIFRENRDNPLFNEGKSMGQTRTALIHWSLMDRINNHFKIKEEHKNILEEFTNSVNDYLEEVTDKQDKEEPEEISSVLRHLRQELKDITEEIEIRQHNREKVMQAISAIESMEATEA